jgi:lipoprotein-releasing system permease protein
MANKKGIGPLSALELLIARRFFWHRKALSTRSSLFALGGLGLGVAVLYVALSVMSGFEKTLQRSLTDVTGHLTVVKRSSEQEDWHRLLSRLQKIDSRVEAATPFIKLEGVVASPGRVQGVLIQGLDSESYQSVLHLESRLIQGSLNLKSSRKMTPSEQPPSTDRKEKPKALIGKDLAARLGKTVGDSFNIVVPRFADLDTSGFRRTLGSFEIEGILDLGKYEWNERMVAIDLQEAQRLGEIPGKYSGLLVKVENPNEADQMASDLVGALGNPYWVKDWRSEHDNIFMALVLERRVIFFVVFILVVVAAFSVSSNLLLQTLQKASDMAVLKSMGLSRKKIRRIFVVQALFLGLVGVLGGISLGFLFSWVLNLYQKKWGLISGAVYKIDHIDLSVRLVDLFWIASSTLLICWLAGLVPAWRAAQREAAEGLRYE